VSSGIPDSWSAADIQARLQRALQAALQARDPAAVSALRSARAAIGNAEAVAAPPGSPALGGNRHFARAAEGLGAAEAPRRVVTGAEAQQIIGAEIAERREAADLYERAGHADRAARLRGEASALMAVLSADTSMSAPPPSTPPPPSDGA
jgi:uncharacterized protein YqeY